MAKDMLQQKQVEIFTPKKDETIYQLTVGDPDAFDESVDVEEAVLDALPSSCNPAKYAYRWINKDPTQIPGHTLALINAGAGGPVSPENHPAIPKHHFTSDRYIMGDAVLWYFNKKAHDEHYYNPKARRNAVDVYKNAQGIEDNDLQHGRVDPRTGDMVFGAGNR